MFGLGQSGLYVVRRRDIPADGAVAPAAGAPLTIGLTDLTTAAMLTVS